MSLFGGVEIPGRPDLSNVRKLDLLAIPLIRRAHRLGIAIDKPYFHELESRFSAELVTLEKDIASCIPAERLQEFSTAAALIEEEGGDASFNPRSSEQICLLLFDMLGVADNLTDDQRAKLKTTASGRYSTGKKQLEIVKLQHPVVPLIQRHRELTKLRDTYAKKLPKWARLHPRSKCCPVCELPHDVESWRIHGEMGTTRAETGRINHKNPNLGNIPTRTDDGQAIQAGFIATAGKRLVARDLSQIELRGLAHLSNCKSMVDVYLADGDLHDDTCHRALGVPWDVKPDKIKHRMAAKRVNFGIQNGTTEKGLYMQLVMDFGTNKIPIPDWLTEEWCRKFIDDWLDSRPEVREYFELQWYRARRYGLSWEPFGRVRLIPEVKSYHRWIQEAGLRQAQNFPVTSVAAGQLKLGMGKADKILAEMWDGGDGVWCWPLLTIHDAIMVEAEEEAAEDVLEALGWALDTVMQDEETGEHRFRVPVKSDGEVMWDADEQVSRWRKG